MRRGPCSGVKALTDTKASDQAWNRRRSWTGTPSSSQMIVTGSGRARCSTRSAGSPCSIMASSSSSTSCWARGLSCWTRRWVKARTAGRRTLVYSGGSRSVRKVSRRRAPAESPYQQGLAAEFAYDLALEAGNRSPARQYRPSHLNRHNARLRRAKRHPSEYQPNHPTGVGSTVGTAHYGQTGADHPHGRGEHALLSVDQVGEIRTTPMGVGSTSP